MLWRDVGEAFTEALYPTRRWRCSWVVVSGRGCRSYDRCHDAWNRDHDRPYDCGWVGSPA